MIRPNDAHPTPSFFGTRLTRLAIQSSLLCTSLSFADRRASRVVMEGGDWEIIKTDQIGARILGTWWSKSSVTGRRNLEWRVARVAQDGEEQREREALYVLEMIQSGFGRSRAWRSGGHVSWRAVPCFDHTE